MGGKSGGDVVVGFRYFMGVQLVGCHGPIDKLKRIIVGEREAWTGDVTANGTIQVDKPNLFGGDSREGGVEGKVDVLMGGPTQGRNDYLATHQGANCSAYRGVFSLVFRQFMWSSGNPYFKSPWLEVTRIVKGWRGDNPWHPELAVINDLDMNPAHIIYQSMTDPAWGMGYTAADMDDAEWLIAAQKLYNEGFGLSLSWDQQTDIESFVQLILNHINGSIGVNLSTGKFRLRLIRDDYDINTLTELNVDNVLELKSFQRAAFGDSANELVVQYVDRDQKDASLAVQDLASIQAQGAVISSTQGYPGIRDAALASRVGLRDLRVLSSPLAKVVLTTNRVMWDKDKGDVVKFVWPLLGINGAAFRIIDIDKGTLADGAISVTMVEDIFGLPNNSYAATPTSQWVDTLVPPIAVNSSKVVEASYWDVIHNVKQSDLKTLADDYGFGLFMASRGSVRSTLSYVLAAAPDDVAYREIGTGYFNPVGNLLAVLDRTTETFTLTGAFDLDNVVLSSDGGYAYIDNECVSVLSVDPLTGVVVVKRGVLDTVPSNHVSGTKVFFVGGSSGYDKTERVSGETVYYKPLPSTGIGTLDLSEATTRVLTLNNRASRPYPPGNLRIDGQLYPSPIVGPAFTVTWAHRDRTAQTVDFVDYSTGNIGPEQGVSYRVRVFNGATLLRTYDLDGTTTSWSYPSSHDNSDGNIATLTISVSSVRDGLESLYAQSHTFQRQVSAGSVGVEGPPATPVISADSQAFAINLTWVLGDGRTNIDYAEIRVSDDPDINHSTVLQNLTYPTMEYLHEIGTALTFKWYWVRVADTSGQLSQWSNVASGRSTSAAVTPQAILDAIEGQIDQTSLSTTLAARINLIDAPGTGLGDRVDALDVLTAATSANVSALSSDVATLLGTAEYSAATTYDIGDMSRYNGYVYRAIQVTTNHLPTDTSYWELVGEYSSLGEIVAAHTAEINTLSSDLSAEVTARETLASQSASALTAAITSEATTRATNDSALSTSITNVSAVANAKNKTFSQTTAPVSGMSAGDLWFDTDDNNKPYRYSGSSWVATDDARIAANAAAITSEATTRATNDSALSTSITNVSAVANAKNKTFSQTTAPVSGMSAGDLWFDTDDNNKPYRYSGSAWVATGDARIAANAAAITSEATTRASADSALASSVTTLQSMVNTSPVTVTRHIVDTNSLTEWVNRSGTGEVSAIADVASSGGYVLHAGNNSADDMWWGAHSKLISVDDELVKVTFRWRRVSGAAGVYLGLEGVADDGVTYVNAVGGNSYSGQHYMVGNAKPTLGAWQVSTAYFKRGAVAGGTGAISSPKFLHENVVFVRPIAVFNYTHDTGECELDYVQVERIGQQAIALEVQATTTADAITGLSAQYTVKIDNDGWISGFGLASEPVNGVPFSEFAILANSFKFGAPDGVKTPFAVVDIGGGVYKTVLNSDVLIGGNVDIANLKTGSLPSDVILRLGGGVVELDGAGEIRVFKDTQPNADFVRLSSGEIRFLRYIAGSYQTYNYLSRLETGIANSGSTVVIPGYWKAQPRVMVSPAILSLYKKDYVNQDQAIDCQAKNIVEVAGNPGRWQFNATATLNLAAASGGSAINLSSGSISSNTYTTATQTTPGNCSNITPSLSLTSVRGNGASQYFRRTIRWRVEYYNGSIWVAGTWTNVAMGDQLGPVVSSALFTFPSAATWQWRITYEAFDTNTSIFGAISYTYTEHTVTAPDIIPGSFTTLPTNGPGAASYPVYGAPGGTGAIYEVVYSATPKIEIRVTSGSQSLYSVGLAYNYNTGVHRTVNGGNGDHQDSGGGVIATGKTWTYLTLTTTSQSYQPGPQTQTITGSNLTFNNKFWSLGTKQTSSLSTVVKLTLTAMSAIVKRRTPVVNSTTPANTFILSSYTYSLTSAQVLATGSMNWMAVGE